MKRPWIPAWLFAMAVLMSFGWVFYSWTGLIFNTIIGLVGFGIADVIDKNRGRMTKEDKRELGGQERALMNSLLRVQRDIIDLSGKMDLEMLSITGDIREESDLVIDRCGDLLRARRRVRLTMNGRDVYLVELETLEMDLARAETVDEKVVISRSIESHRDLLKRFDDRVAALDDLDTQVRLARMILREMKAKLAAGLLRSQIDVQTDSLNEMMVRLKALNSSIDEVQSIFQENSL